MDRLSFLLTRVAQGEAYQHIYTPEALLRQVNQQLQTLYRRLLAPLGLSLEGRKLVIVPHGPLHAIPFAALFDGQRHLLDRTQVSLAPSLAVYAFCTQKPTRPGGPLVAFGVPVEDIPQTLREAQTVADLFPGAQKLVGGEASLEAFFQNAPKAQVLHIATHGAFRPDNPMFSGLRLSDGWLAARDLYGMRLQAALVVLSACETGLFGQGSGDEVLGLARGFLYAGAPSLVTSLWPVHDEHTAELMAEFYTRLRQGTPVAAALREAQLALKERHPNPYYWAAFTITGDPQRTIEA
ncbi:MAG TPA: CHAT domain-containing protein [Meiothermus sp.]|nr:CHAT domain-containing protein [Meiothermus sp.]